MELITDDPEVGKHYHDEESGISVFEDIKGESPRFCAWEGALETYPAASRTPWAASIEEAVDMLQFQQFRCANCGKMRARYPKKKWSDNCKDGGVHDWEPMPGKKKMQPGRKINMWIADSQLLEIEQLSNETGNDRASTIRDLIAIGLKCRRRIDNLTGAGD